MRTATTLLMLSAMKRTIKGMSTLVSEALLNPEESCGGQA